MGRDNGECTHTHFAAASCVSRTAHSTALHSRGTPFDGASESPTTAEGWVVEATQDAARCEGYTRDPVAALLCTWYTIAHCIG